MRKIGWWRWPVEGLENLPPRAAGGMILATNHSNWIDIPVIGAMAPFNYRLSWLAKSELFAHPVAKWFFHTMHVLPINRGKRDLAAPEVAGKALRDGAVLLIYPGRAPQRQWCAPGRARRRNPSRNAKSGADRSDRYHRHRTEPNRHAEG